MANKEFFDYYSRGGEKDRYKRCVFEFERTKDILARNMNTGKKRVLDMGGGTGYYSFWLTSLGYQVDLRDIVPANIDIAKQQELETNISLNSAEIGDATHIEFGDKIFDYVLLFGPMYHIQSYEDRIKALSEARRVLKDDGRMFCVFIHRNSALMDFLKIKDISDDLFKESALEARETGCFNNRYANHFTYGYFYSIDEFRKDISDVQLAEEQIMSIEGVDRIIEGFNEKIMTEENLNTYLDLMRVIEKDESIFGVSSHLMAILKK